MTNRDYINFNLQKPPVGTAVEVCSALISTNPDRQHGIYDGVRVRNLAGHDITDIVVYWRLLPEECYKHEHNAQYGFVRFLENEDLEEEDFFHIYIDDGRGEELTICENIYFEDSGYKFKKRKTKRDIRVCPTCVSKLNYLTQLKRKLKV